MIKRILQKLLAIFYMEVRSKEGVLHFQRFKLIPLPFISLYIHAFYQSDKDIHLHNHPRWLYWSLHLWGTYKEHTKNGSNLRKPGNIKPIWRDTFHKIEIVDGPTLGVVLVLGSRKEWGYSTKRGFISAEQYRLLKNQKKLDDSY